jgi:hypothetical protein
MGRILPGTTRSDVGSAIAEIKGEKVPKDHRFWYLPWSHHNRRQPPDRRPDSLLKLSK